jgi:tetratricopeptide (TPR) repeat protein
VESVRGSGWRWLALVCLATLGCRLEPATVTRLSGGVPVTGRYVSPEAYAAYSRGALHEARGDEVAALAAYQQALAEDADAPEILARIGAVQCRLSRRAGDGWAHAARQSLTRALSSDPLSSTAWLQRARCDRRLHRFEEALAAAIRAATLDPTSTESVLLVVDVAEESGREDLARTWLDALVVDEPVTRESWLRLAAFAARHRDAGRLLRARAGLRALGLAEPPDLLLDDSLTTGNLERARRAAIELRMTPGRLAVRAALAGALALARTQAELVLAADPDDSDAWTAALLSASLEPDPARFAETLAHAPEAPTPPSPEALAALNELLARIAGPDANAALRAPTH